MQDDDRDVSDVPELPEAESAAPSVEGETPAESTRERRQRLASEVSRMLGSPKALFWLEVLSLLGAAGHGIVLLRECAAFFVVRYAFFKR